jgi:hypothetical protein
MVDRPIALDEQRGLAEQRATEIRRRLAEVAADHAALQQRRGEIEKLLVAAPAASWREVAEKARYLITILAETFAGRDRAGKGLSRACSRTSDGFPKAQERPSSRMARCSGRTDLAAPKRRK